MRRSFLTYLVWPGFVGGLVAIAGSLLLRSLQGTATLAEIAADATSFIIGPQRFSYLLDKLEGNAKALLFLGVLLGQFALYWLLAVVVGYLARRRWGQESQGHARPTQHLTPFALQAGLATGALLITSVGLIAFTPADLPSRTGWHEYALAIGSMAIVYAVIAEGLRIASSKTEQPESTGGGQALSRRRFFQAASGLAAVVAAAFVSREVMGVFGGGARDSHLGHPTPEISPNDDFYVVSKNFIDPKVDADNWSLKVGGSAQRMLELTYDDIRRLPSQEEFVTLQCISNPVGGELIGNAKWKGFPLRALLEQAGPLPSAQFLSFRCHDDYTETLPLDFANRDQVRLVYEMNGEPLPFDHGFPVRLLAPGKYGIKNPKWITEIALIDEEAFGYWQQRGWSQEARMQTSTRIDVPAHRTTVEEGPFRIHGIAFSGDRGINRVEVSYDNGETWHDASLRPTLSPYTWLLWHFDWQAEAREAPYTLMARSTDGTDEVQTPELQPSRPNTFGGIGWEGPLEGNTGYPKIFDVEVRKTPL